MHSSSSAFLVSKEFVQLTQVTGNTASKDGLEAAVDWLAVNPNLESLVIQSSLKSTGLSSLTVMATKASPPLKTLAFVEKDVLSLCSNIKHVEELTLSLADEEDVDFDALSYRCRLRCKRLDELHFRDTYENILRLPGGVTQCS